MKNIFIFSLLFNANISPLQNVMLGDVFSDFTAATSLTPGIEYFARVEACNSLFLCSTMTSHKLVADVTPPTSGVVTVGHDLEHSQYIASRYFFRLILIFKVKISEKQILSIRKSI